MTLVARNYKKYGYVPLIACFFTLSIVGCSSSDDPLNDDPFPPLPPYIESVSGQLFDQIGSSPPFEELQIEIQPDEGEAVTVIPRSDGSFSAEDIGSSSITVAYPNQSKNIYRLDVDKAQETASVEIIVDPIFARITGEGVSISPNEDAKAGTARILQPVDGQGITCNENLPRPCRFLLEGVATPVLGQVGTPYRLYAIVIPLEPVGSGVFPQFPAVSVDPISGDWQTEVQFGNEQNQPEEGDKFSLSMVVTDQPLIDHNSGDSLSFEVPSIIPGLVYISGFVEITIGKR